MRKYVKKLGSIVFILTLLLFVTGCGKEELKNTVKENTQKSEEKKEETPQEEYFDVDTIKDKDVDYSKYEEKKSERGEKGSSFVTYSDGSKKEKDQYQTGTIPEGMQNPVEPGTVHINKEKKQTCYLTISCQTVLNNMDKLTEGKESLISADGMILSKRKVTFYEGESVFDVLKRETRNNRIHMEYAFNPLYNSNYVEGIHNLYEFDCGQNSGWLYNVNGWYANYGCSRYIVQEGDEIEWIYTCDLGRDIGADWAGQNGER